MECIIETTKPQEGYELLDSGLGEKLERYGAFTVARPDSQALWPKRLPPTEWDKADAHYVRKGVSGKWVKKEGLPEKWQVALGGNTFEIELSPFKHVGVFPEQLPNWKWIEGKIKDQILKIKDGERQIKVLNLFGYTGGATLSALSAGAEVVHVDASKPSLSQARENARLSGLGEKPIRWILDDALKFVLREVRRGAAYDGIIMDPPTYGRGAKGELWKLEEKLLPLLAACKKLLSKDPLFFVVNGYASGYSAIAYKNCLELLMKDMNGKIEAGELAIADVSGRFLPAGIFARWSK